MKTYRILFHGCCLAAALLTAVPLTGQTIKDSRVFKARRQTNITQSLSRAQTTVSDTIPLQDLGAIYAFSIDATITQPREASFVRIVLEDTEGHDYLVAESDRFRNDTSIVQLSEYCEETAKLPGITPLRLKCYLAGDATLQLTSYHASDQEPTRGEQTNEETSEAIKEVQVQSIVDRINEYNIRHHRLWRAAANDISLKRHEELNQLYGTNGADAYLTNLIYYSRGIYEIGSVDSISPEPICNYVDSFDWSNRHGKNWITEAKDQGSTLFCQTYAVVGMVEAVAGLYYNDTLNLDLSELDVFSYTYNYDYANCYNFIGPISYIRQNGVIDEATLPFNGYGYDNSIIEPRPEGDELVTFQSYYLQTWLPGDIPLLNDIKSKLWQYGPCCVGIMLPAGGHALLLYGYGKVEPGHFWCFSSNYSSEHYDEIIPSNDPRIGRTYWKIKNSWGTGWGENGHGRIVCHNYDDMRPFYFATGTITSKNKTDSDIICEDADGDGYYNWGIKQNIPASLPSWAPRTKDSDDANCLIGDMNYKGFQRNINPDSLEVYIINGDSVFNSDRFIGNHILIQNNSTLTVSSLLVTNNVSRITIKPGSKLIIDGGCIKNSIICPEVGSSIILNNGGKIKTYKGRGLEVPLGAILQINQGSIEK